jgi:UTP--glucose-1-phosphate uridylyltransferase
MVTKWDKKPLEDHFDHSWALENDLEKSGKTELANKMKGIAEMANFIYIRQKGPYGNGTPIISAASLVENEPFIFCFGDDLVKSKVSFTKQMIDEYEKNGNLMIGVQEVPLDQVSRYGILKLKDGSNQIEGIIEKPSVEEAPSQFAQFGRFILNQEIINHLKSTSLGKGNELWLTDAIQKYIENGGIITAKKVEDGEWLTTGDPLNYLKTILKYACDREDLKDDLKDYLKTLNL